jgi:hypothetical protein
MTLLHVPSLIPVTDPSGRHTAPWLQLWTNLTSLVNKGYPPAALNAAGQSVPQVTTIATAKLTPGGANGSLTFTNGILTGQVAAT